MTTMKNGRHFKVPKLKCVKVLVIQLCPTLCDPTDCSLPSSSVHGILQARILEWVAIPFSRGSCRPRDWTWDSCFAGRFFTIWATSSVQSLCHVWLFATPWTAARQASLSITNSRSLPKLVHRVGDAIQPSHPLSSPSPPAPDPSQHQSLFQWVSSSHQVAKVLELQLQHWTFHWILRTDFLYNWLVWSPCSPRDSQESSPAPQFKSINSLALNFLYGPTLTSIHDYWKSHSFD